MDTLKVYLDMCCYNRPYDDQSQLKVSLETQAKLHIQALIRQKRMELAASYMLRYECSQNPFEMRRNAILDFIDANAQYYVDTDRLHDVEEKAAEMIRAGVKYKDACHVASAILSGCSYFVSTDIRLLKHKRDDIKMVNPIDLISEMEDE